jgi:hypothetical protein
MVISDKASQALYGACVTRGKAKGLLKRNPPKDRLARAAWYGAQIVCNPYKVSISAIMFFDDEERAIYREIEALMENWKANTSGSIVHMDQDRSALEKMGAW